MLDKESTKSEIDSLARLYCEKRYKFEKDSKIRWILTFCAFALVFSYIFIVISVGDIKSLFSEDIMDILAILLAGILITGFHFFINVSVFGWLFQKDIAEGRRLDDIVKQIRDLEKTLN